MKVSTLFFIIAGLLMFANQLIYHMDEDNGNPFIKENFYRSTSAKIAAINWVVLLGSTIYVLINYWNYEI